MARVAKLNALGFVWEASVGLNRDDAGWERWFVKLKEYQRTHGDCIVPRDWAEDQGLSTWVKNQRHFKKKLGRGESSDGMTAARAAKLEALGFFEPPAASKQRSAALVQPGPPRRRETAARAPAPATAVTHATAAAEPGRPAEVGPAVVARHPPGARVARRFGDG